MKDDLKTMVARLEEKVKALTDRLDIVAGIQKTFMIAVALGLIAALWKMVDTSQ